MKNTFEANAGLALIAGCVLIIVTMVLHPAGGSFEHLVSIIPIIIISHSIALLAIPFCLVGFWGLTKRLADVYFLSITAFAIIAFGLVAVMCAGAVNGLVLPLFIKRYKTASAETIDSIKPILTYNSTLNHAFDYIFIGAACLAILIWSIAILKTKAFPVWIGYFGLLLAFAAIGMLGAGFVFVNLTGFRVFIFGLVSWILLVGYLLRKPVSVDKS